MNKQLYIDFCEKNLDEKLPIFSLPWWLDAVCGSECWDAIVLDDKRGGIKCLMPVTYRNQRRDVICMPTLTQKLGPFIIYPKNQSEAKKLSFENEVIKQILDELPSIESFNVNFDYTFTNWLPFYWAGFQQTTKYTYVIDNLDDDVFSRFAPAKRTDIRKARELVEIKHGLSGVDFIDYYIESLKKQGKKLSYDKELFERLFEAVINHGSGDIIYGVIREEPNEIAGAIFYVWDKNSIYSMVTAFDPDYRNTGASSLLFYSIMERFKDSGLKFDFEGSMIKSIEQSYNKFGTTQTPYFNISKVFSRKTKIKRCIKEFLHLIKER